MTSILLDRIKISLFHLQLYILSDLECSEKGSSILLLTNKKDVNLNILTATPSDISKKNVKSIFVLVSA